MAVTKNESCSQISILRNKEKHWKTKGPKFGKRHIQILILTVLLTISCVVRGTLSIAIIAMTNSEVSSNKDVPTYTWTNKNLILSAFLWGCFIPQIGAGYLADRFGAKWFLSGGSFIGFFAGLCIPFFASLFGSEAVVVLRIIQGLSQAFLYPSIASIMGKWIPCNERSLYGAILFSGGPLGVMVSMVLTGYISASSYGWPYVFYIFNGLGITISLLYSYFGSSDPSRHSTISEGEKYYILGNLEVELDRIHIKLPLKEICLSMPFYSLLVANISYNFTFYLFLTETPIYLKEVLSFNIQSNGLLTSLPYGVEILTALAASYVSNILLLRNIMNITNIRKIMNNFSFLVSAIALILLSNSGLSSVNLIVILIICVTGSQGTAKAGFLVNYMDLSPNFSGVLMGITNSFGILVSATTPLLVQYIVQDEKNISEWRKVFYIALAVNIFAFVFNTVFTSGEVQRWNKGRKNEIVEELPKYHLVPVQVPKHQKSLNEANCL